MRPVVVHAGRQVLSVGFRRRTDGHFWSIHETKRALARL